MDQNNSPQNPSRRRLLRNSAGAVPVVLTLVSAPVRATYYTTPASSFASINSSRPHNTHTTTGCKPSWWKTLHINSWPASCVNSDNAGNRTHKKFKDCIGTGSTWDDWTLLQCVEDSSESGNTGMMKHLVAAYLNACAGKTPAELCSVPIVRGMWSEFKTKGYYEPTAGIKWYADYCSSGGNGGCTPWLKTTMPYS